MPEDLGRVFAAWFSRANQQAVNKVDGGPAHGAQVEGERGQLRGYKPSQGNAVHPDYGAVIRSSAAGIAEGFQRAGCHEVIEYQDPVRPFSVSEH